MESLHQLEMSGFLVWIRSSASLWSYPAILFLHTVGMALAVGVSAVISLQILGFAPEVPLRPMIRLAPIMWIGFWINAVSGTTLLLADITMKLKNPSFYVKMVFIALALVNVQMIKRHVFDDPLIDNKPLPSDAKMLAVTSLIFWLGAITAGRLMAYTLRVG